MGEGGAVLILEELGPGPGPRRPRLRRDRRRGQHRRRLPHHRARPARRRGGGVHGAGPARRRADARRPITHINAHGTSTPANDLPESEAIVKVFGSPGPAVTSIKGITGHSLGGGRLARGRRPGPDHRAGPDPSHRRPDRAGPRDPHRRRHRRAPGVDAGAGAVQLVRLRRPQRHAGDGPAVGWTGGPRRRGPSAVRRRRRQPGGGQQVLRRVLRARSCTTPRPACPSRR